MAEVTGAGSIRWAISPHDGRRHAFAPAQGDGMTERGPAEAMCGHEIRGYPIAVDTPRGAVCAYCAMTLAPDVEDRAALLAGWGGPVVLS